jgi:hypothetical protein
MLAADALPTDDEFDIAFLRMIDPSSESERPTDRVSYDGSTRRDVSAEIDALLADYLWD